MTNIIVVLPKLEEAKGVKNILVRSGFQVLLLPNLYGDIITDEAGAVVGGVGYSASGCILSLIHI